MTTDNHYKRGDWIPSNQSLIGKLLRFPLNLIPKGTIVPILGSAARGKKWILGSGAHSQWLGIHEIGKKKVYKKAIKSGSVVYDIGANVGIYTIISSILCGETGHVYAFEPVPVNAKYLKKHVELNKLNNVTIVETAVSDVDGYLQFKDDGDHCTSHISIDGEIKVESQTIDSFVFTKKNKPPGYLKIDVEGAEVSVLQGGKKVLNEYKPEIFLATHGYELDRACRNLLAQLNYKVNNLPGSADELYAIPELS